ncbi:luciferin 4-monooxygenase-like [Battus philenor]|uniref:luciferin 4-monooxygenase-like n=1 Tax=Battus philenor TaxID=42288 RepID=UPI0035CFAC0B
MIKNPLYVYGDKETLKVPAHLNYGRHILDKFKTFKQAVAIINAESGEKITYKEIVQKAVDIALSLARIGVRKGQVVNVCSEKRMEFIPTVLGAICAGATYASSDVSCRNASFLYRINLSKPTVVFCSPTAYEDHRQSIKSVKSIEHIIIYGDKGIDNAMSFKEFLTVHADIEEFLAADVNGWEDVAIILQSSGTTGLPKGIKLTHLNLLLFLSDTGEKKEQRCGEVKTLITREWYHSYGFGHTIYAMYEGTTVVYCPRSEVKCFLEAIQKYKIQVMQLTPATVIDLVKSTILSEYDVSSLAYMVSTSTYFNAELVNAIRARFPNLQAAHQYYGMSEAGCVCSDILAPKGPKVGSVGCAGSGFTLKVVDLFTRKPLGPNQRGEICFKSSSLMLGYVGDDPVDYLDDEGFFKTGDIGYYDEDRYFYIVDRMKELIKFNSYQVAPAELEAVLMQHPGVANAGVAGAPDPECGELPTAFVVLRAGYEITPDELVRYVDEQVSHRMRLAGGVRIVDSLPMVPSGKLDRKLLKKILTESK